MEEDPQHVDIVTVRVRALGHLVLLCSHAPSSVDLESSEESILVSV